MNYKKFIAISVLMLIVNLSIYSQLDLNANDSLIVHNTIIKLFDGMREGDSAKVHTVFYDHVRMFTSFRTKQGETKLKEGGLTSFLQAVGNGHKEIWDERIFDTFIKIDGNLAQVWTGYSFFVDKKLSHCGVDAFQLVKDKYGVWKIINLIDTRRQTECK